MKTPKYLSKGSKIAIVSPAGYINPDFVKSAEVYLKSICYNVEISEHCLGRFNQMASTDDERLADLQQALDNPEINAILCSRGGYGVNHIIDKIDMTKFAKKPKWILGFSDITNLHLLANKHGVRSLHCQMAKAIHNNSEAECIKNIFRILEGEKISYTFEPNELNRKGTVKGELIGGNMSIIYSLQGTDFAIDCDDKILFIEDLNEYLYHLDRMMLNLKMSGKLAKLRGLVVGSFSDMKDNASPFGKTAYEIVKAHTAEYSYPIGFGIPVGHIDDNQPLVEGGQYRLEISDTNCSLTML
ncbi:MAG: LD-carboxypeptidase [Bacteroidales bacterium]|nr:LD-carboxypeptidase [Bacteroidales bacterium]MBQ2351207.1 LD-carboxypeptidase [Bacteroidales bacterium]